ncbi:Uncharacterized protein Rs2_38487 [Raphanus sativus]|nr:Uncharacterized protein Rs2_38487 [Raphanus sativus]
MEKTLQWLVPVATNTTKAHHGFGWVGEWASSGSEANQRPVGQTILRIDTLHHADKEKAESYMLDLVVWLHHLVTQVRATTGFGLRSPVKSPIRSPNQKAIQLSSGSHKPNMGSPLQSMEDKEMLRDVSKRRKMPGISKSQEFQTVAKSRLCKHQRVRKSSSHLPVTGEMMNSKKDTFSIRRPSFVPIIDFDIDRMKALDVIDRVVVFGDDICCASLTATPGSGVSLFVSLSHFCSLFYLSEESKTLRDGVTRSNYILEILLQGEDRCCLEGQVQRWDQKKNQSPAHDPQRSDLSTLLLLLEQNTRVSPGRREQQYIEVIDSEFTCGQGFGSFVGNCHERPERK